MNPLYQQLSAQARVQLSDAQQHRLDRFVEMLLDANRRMNLTRIDDPAGAQVQHVGDAMTLLPHLPHDAHTIADVGSGGGVPGIPLAIIRPDAQVTLIESTKKKAVFLREAVAQLELTNVAVVDRRAEEVGAAGSPMREQFEVVVVRAVGALVWLVEWCLPLVKVGGKLLAMKGPKGIDELPAAKRAIDLLGGAVPVVHPVELPGTAGRVILEIAKRTRTDRRFPRDPTMARGKPLG